MLTFQFKEQLMRLHGERGGFFSLSLHRLNGRPSLPSSASTTCRDKGRGGTEMLSDQMNFIGP